MRVSPWLLLVLGVAAVPRLGWLDRIEFKNDEAWALTVATSIARGHAHPLVGIGSSIGVPNAPFFVYLMALPELLSHDPAVATGLIGLLGVASVGATYAFGRWLVDAVAGRVAAVLLAVSPWDIIYNRKVWGQDALPAFVAVGMFCLFVAYRDRRRRLIVPALIALTLAGQLHPTGLTLVIPAAILVGACLLEDRAEPSRSLGPLVVGVATALVLEAPFGLWQLRNGWPLFNEAAHLAGDPAKFDLQALHFAVSVAVGNGYPTLGLVGDWWSAARWVELALLVGGLAWLVHTVVASPKWVPRVEALALGAWLAAPIAIELHHSVPVYPHYFIVLFPAPFLVMGTAASWLWAGRWRSLLQSRVAWVRQPDVLAVIRAVVIVVVSLPIGLGLVAFGDYMHALGSRGARPEFGLTLGQQKQLLAEAGELAAAGPIYVGSHDDLAPSLAYLGDGGVHSFDDRVGLLLPSGSRPAAVIEADPTTTAGVLLRRLVSEPVPSLHLPGGGSEFIFRLTNGGSAPAPGFRPLDATFDDGISLTSYRVARDSSQRVVVDLILRLDGSPPTVIPTAFNHLIDPSGQTVSHLDGPAYPDLHWQKGDSCLSEFVLPAPPTPGPYQLELGLYDYPSLHRHAVTGQFANAPRDALELDLADFSAS